MVKGQQYDSPHRTRLTAAAQTAVSNNAPTHCSYFLLGSNNSYHQRRGGLWDAFGLQDGVKTSQFQS